MADASANIDIKAPNAGKTAADVQSVSEQLEGLKKAASGMQEILSKVIIPAAIATKLVDQVRDIIAAKNELEQAIAASQNAVSQFGTELVKISGKKVTDSAEAQMKALQERISAEGKKAAEDFEQQLTAIRDRSPLGNARNFLFGGQTEASLREQFEKAEEMRADAAIKATQRLQRTLADEQAKADDDRRAKNYAEYQKENAEILKRLDEQAAKAADNQKQLEKQAIESAQRIAEAMADAMLESMREALRQNQAFLAAQSQAIEATLGNFAAVINATEEPGWGEG